MRMFHEHFSKKVMNFVIYCFLFIILMGVINIVLGAVLKGFYFPELGLLSAAQVCIEAFCGISSNTGELPIYFQVFIQIIRDCYFVFIAGFAFSKMSEPINPIYFSKYFTYNTADERFSFRYWLLFKLSQYAYDVNIRVFVADEDYCSGKNHIKMIWEWKSEDQQLTMARGVRFIEFTDFKAEEDSSLFKILKAGKRVCVIISGQNENGHRFYKSKEYDISNLAVDYEFLSIQKKEFKDTFKIAGDEIKKIPTTRYQYFDKLYKISRNEDDLLKSPDVRDVVTAEMCKKRNFINFVEDKISSFFAKRYSSQSVRKKKEKN